MPPHYIITREQQHAVLRLAKLGWGWKQIARQMGFSVDAVRFVRAYEQRPSFGWVPRAGCLTFADREEITIGLAQGESY